ncbi:hypothetical protein ACP8HI_20490 [Paenibacillus sp. FA6]|uniref:hypothetical protein n=1 Tax=Paenibacillus sp. FA6 TaxID=3413029 RepID=UPI003F65D3E2
MAIRESDLFIVLRDRESRLHGEGIDKNMKLVKETYAGHVGLEHRRQTSLQGIARKARRNQTHRYGNVYGFLMLTYKSECS